MLTELQPFIGRFHPLLVHLPIGFLLLAGALELLARVPRFEGVGLRRLMPTVLGLTALTTLGAIVTGNLLSWSGEYDAALVGRHQQWGLMLGVAVTLACVAAWWRTRAGGAAPDRLYAGAFVVALVLVAGTGHFGGSLTHGETYLTEHMPAPFSGRQIAPPMRRHRVRRCSWRANGQVGRPADRSGQAAPKGQQARDHVYWRGAGC